MENKTESDVLNMIGEDLVLRMVQLLKLKNKIATGNLIDSIDYIIGDKKGEKIVKLLADYYFTYVNNGRRPGKGVPRAELEEWMAIRGIPKEAYWAINWKIKRDGIKGIFVLEEVIQQLESQYATELESLWGEAYQKEFERIFRNNFRNIK